MDFEEKRRAEFSRTGRALGVPLTLLESVTKMPAGGYHNAHHARSVALLAYEGADFYDIEDAYARLMFIAGIYHDQGHSLGERPDIENIQHAVESFHRDVKKQGFSGEEARFVERMICATEHRPYNPAYRESLSKMEKILKDADLLVWTVEDEEELQWLCDGLSRESGHKVTFASTRSFLESQTFYTQWAKQRLQASYLFRGTETGSLPIVATRDAQAGAQTP